MELLNAIKDTLPDYAKDIRLNLDGALARSSLEGHEAIGVALASAFAARSSVIIQAIQNAGVLSTEEQNGALTAAALMGMNNVWYPYPEMTGDAELKQQPAELRMNAYANHGGIDKRRFEMYALAASIIGRCHFCVRSHFETLRKEGLSAVQLRDIGRIAATIYAAAQVIAVEQG